MKCIRALFVLSLLVFCFFVKSQLESVRVWKETSRHFALDRLIGKYGYYYSSSTFRDKVACQCVCSSRYSNSIARRLVIRR